MPQILLAGLVTAAPKVENFPTKGKPRTEVRIRTEDGRPAVFRVIGFDEQSDELALLAVGDSVAVVGQLELESQDNRLVSVFIVARETMPLARRSRHRTGGLHYE
jgi:S1-C subfamily serine protease